ncbi:hypothetical protein P168DRAFT_304062 [Aspergillus campestris IBT 28561]|uniref:GPI inositol-deacylase n=1 Tax=Aspergillus campestris (strain IBT 28561) TaxID=1392248 RepID=A0A2I1D506_ASPC2|nr:uncharacterized protein P168DRAFT_304062 [Aspergillus campestris IBT 28561]PKY04955.1 hypothetical protein P168DRAFT_304062 [Aspergillus campestris IBT 28561]
MHAFDKLRRKFRKKTTGKSAAARNEVGGAAGKVKPSNSSSSAHNLVSSITNLFPGNKVKGIKVLHAPPKPDVDIVFLHGLTGRADKTFFHTKTQKYWPVNLLRRDLPNARILSFGYHADLGRSFRPVGQNTLESHASNLVNDLARVREADESEVPQEIIFVAHSLGGLVVKKAMEVSEHSADEHLMQIEKETVGIAFLGTPHRGADIAPFTDAIANIVKISGVRTNAKILDTLERNSQVLGGVETYFDNWIRKNNGRIRLDMARFSRVEDDGYQRISGELKRWTRRPGKRLGQFVVRGQKKNLD